MHKKWVWGIAFVGAVAIIVMAAYSVQNYNEQLEAGSGNTSVPASENTNQSDNETAGDTDTVENDKVNAEPDTTSQNEPTKEPTEEEKEPEKELAPDFTLQDMDGNDVSISDFRGKKVFLTFWATWCPYCKEQMPFMQELEEEEREDLVILTVATADSLGLKSHLEDNGFTFTVLQDYRKTLDKVQFKYKAMTIPGNILIDEEGYIVAKRNSFKTREVMDKFLSKFEES